MEARVQKECPADFSDLSDCIVLRHIQTLDFLSRAKLIHLSFLYISNVIKYWNIYHPASCINVIMK